MGFWVFMTVMNLLLPFVMLVIGRFASVIPTVIALRKHFDKDGNRIQI